MKRTREHDTDAVTPPLFGIFLTTKSWKIWPEFCFLFGFKICWNLL